MSKSTQGFGKMSSINWVIGWRYSLGISGSELSRQSAGSAFMITKSLASYFEFLAIPLAALSINKRRATYGTYHYQRGFARSNRAVPGAQCHRPRIGGRI